MDDDMKKYELDDDSLDNVSGGVNASTPPPCEGRNIAKLDNSGPLSCDNCVLKQIGACSIAK